MNDKKFNAILDKNSLAKMLKEIYEEAGKTKDTGIEHHIKSTVRLAIVYLKQIEEYLGEANQPSVEDTFNSDY